MTLEPLAYTRASLAEFCYPTLDLTPQIRPYPRVAFRLSCVNLTRLFDFFYIFEWPGFPSLNENPQSISKPIEQSPGK